MDERKPFGKAARNLGLTTVSEIGKERIRRAAKHLDCVGEKEVDCGFKVYKLAKSNFLAWEPLAEDLENTLFSSVDHIERDRTQHDILTELLLKLGLDLCVPIETQTIAGKAVHSVGAGTLIACLDEAISSGDAEPLAAGVSDWHDALAPAGDSTVVFRDSAFADDVAKTNLAEILKQRGLGNVRSL